MAILLPAAAALTHNRDAKVLALRQLAQQAARIAVRRLVVLENQVKGEVPRAAMCDQQPQGL